MLGSYSSGMQFCIVNYTTHRLLSLGNSYEISGLFWIPWFQTISFLGIGFKSVSLHRSHAWKWLTYASYMALVMIQFNINLVVLDLQDLASTDFKFNISAPLQIYLIIFVSADLLLRLCNLLLTTDISLSITMIK